MVDHYAIAKSRNLSQWARKPNVDMVLRLLFQDGWNHVENVLAQIAAQAIDNPATAGAQLDAFGPLLNQPRMGGPHPNGEPDADYRVKLKAAIYRNRSCGSDVDVRKVIRALLPDLVDLATIPQFPAAFRVQVQVPAPLSADMNAALGQFVRASTSAGIGVEGVAVYTDPVFGFAGGGPAIQGFDVAPFATFV